MSYMIGVDIGTTNTKAVVFTAEGMVLATAGVSYQARTDADGMHELDPAVLLNACFSVIHDVAKSTAGQNGLAGISFSCAMHSLIAIGSDGVPLTGAITWADLRSKPYAEKLRNTETGRRIYRQTGTPIHPMSPLSKLLWLKSTAPEIFSAAARFISIKEYIWWRMFGAYEVDHSIASATGLFDIYALDWFDGSLEVAGIGRHQLSKPVACTHSRILDTEYGLLPGLPMGVPVIIGGSDGCLANLGSGALRPGETALTIGTSGAIRMTAPAPKYDAGERIFNYVLTDKFYVSGGATNNGGGALQWYAEHFQGGGMEEGEIGRLLEAAAKTPASSEGVIFLPYLQGERAPIWDAEAKAVFFGMRSTHGPPDLVRAILEGICFSLYQIGAVLEDTIGPIGAIHASGGFTRSPFWLQMLADIFMKKVHTTSGADASAIGAAIIGFHALGLLPDLEDAHAMIKMQDTYEPDADRHRSYQQKFMIYAALYDRLKDLM